MGAVIDAGMNAVNDASLFTKFTQFTQFVGLKDVAADIVVTEKHVYRTAVTRRCDNAIMR